MRKTLQHYEIYRVVAMPRDGIGRELQQLYLGPLRGKFDSPEGTFIISKPGKQIVLPRRNRGEKFLVDYTECKRAIL